MNRWQLRTRWTLLLVLLTTAVMPVAADNSWTPAIRAKFDPTFLHQILEASPSKTWRFLVMVRGEAGLAQIPATLSSEEQRTTVVERLKAAATEGQAHLIPALRTLKKQEHVQSFQPFWIFNGIAVSGDRTALLALAAREDVQLVRPDRWQQWIVPQEDLPTAAKSAQVDWGISQIRADQVWSALEIDGDGAVVATMDTGADWQHPILQPSYRGWHEGTAIHTGNWYDATGEGALYPVDSLGHGTHVMGLLAGQEGVGVAPGARWIAVRAFDSGGYGLDSWIHAGFQWLLAPAGDPALAPDIVNNSWSNSIGGNEEFRPDVQALIAAGILPIFAAGNQGPEEGSIGAPASYPESLAVGASDPYDEIAAFSGRGPSPFGGIKPELVAPGVNLLSSLPGGAFGEKSGTSMASPLIAGVAALLIQADLALSADQIINAITSTAVPIGSPWPNMNAGWGRVDALTAVASILNPGYLEGIVRGFGGAPLTGATVRATEHGGGASAGTQTGSDGSWSLVVSPGIYDLEATAFGYAPAVETGVMVITGTITQQDLALSPLPSGRVEGQIVAADSGEPLPAVLRVSGTPVTTTANTLGAFALGLPAGSYTLTAEHWGYRVSQAEIKITIDHTTERDFALDPSPAVLLVDSGEWYYGSEIDYFQTALDDLGYLYDQQEIRYVPQETPTITDLLPYDAVIWSSPADSPGFIGAGEVISDYLAAGGNLLLSGQDAGYWDSGANGYFWSPYYRYMLQARFLADDAESLSLNGTGGGLLDGLTLTLNGPESAGNQTRPDRVEPVDPDRASPLLNYADSGHGGVEAGLCLPYRSFYLSFGLEGAGERASRAEVMGRALDWFSSPRLTVGAALRPSESHLVAPAGSSITHTIQLHNTGEARTGDTYTLGVAGAAWPTTIPSSTITLSPCEIAQVQVEVNIPAGLGRDLIDQALLTARSTVSPTLVITAVLTTKTPAPILLVDDDRWYDQETIYQDALEAGDFGYDYWDARSQSSDLLASNLSLYPSVLWFTGYDWYAPLTNQEIAGLEAYLAGGGRLFLSSQDALYYQADTPFSHHYLGVLAHGEDVTPTIAYAAEGKWALPGSLVLDYPFRNLSDGLISAEGATVEFYNDSGWAMGLTNKEHDPGDFASQGGWKTAFFSFPFEALPAGSRPQVMDQVVGWLGWLGESEFEASDRVVSGGVAVTFTATLRNDGPGPVTAVFSNSLPAALDLISGTLVGGSYDGQTIRWEGSLPAGGERIIRYAGTVSEALSNTVVIHYAEHDLTFHKPARVWTDAPDLSLSTLTAEPPVVVPGRPVTYTLQIHNGGLVTAPEASTKWALPTSLTVLSSTLAATGGSVSLNDHVIRWSGSVAAGETITLSLTTLTLASLRGSWLSSAAVLDDGVTEVLVRGHQLELRPMFFYLPIVMRWS